MPVEQYTNEFDVLRMRCDVVEEKEQISRGGSVANQQCFKGQGLGHLIADCPNQQLVTLVEEDVEPVYDDYEDYDEGLEDHLIEGEEITYTDSGESLVVRSGIAEAIILATNETAGHVRNKDAVVHSYNNGFSGFAAHLSEAESKSIAQRPGVISIFPDPILQLHTTRSWDFLQYQTEVVITFGGSDNSSTKGADTIIGILDTRIWPEVESFNDNDMSEVPSRWKGTCMKSHDSSSFKCNKKLVGARFYGDDDEDGVKPSGSARDQNGHGTHVASTAVGSPISRASYFGLGSGIAKGGSPGSRIAMYHVCTDGGCHESSIMAFDDAIADRVDVLSLSLGLLSSLQAEFSSDPIAIGAFHAVEKGILIACSTGNQGPQAETVVNVMPCILTVAATMIDRDFETHIVLGGNKVMIKGGGISFGNLTSSPVYPLITGDLAKSADSDVSRYCLPDSVGIFAISHSCSGVAARACGLVSLEPKKIAKILKDRPPWFRDRRNVEVFTMFPAGSGSTVELLLIPSGYLIRPYDGGGSIIHIVDHLNLEAWSAPEILRPLYESLKVVAQKMTIAALRYAKQLAQKTSAEVVYGLGRQPAIFRTFSQRLCRGFNDAINAFSDDGWLMLSSDSAEDVIVAVSSRKNLATTFIPLSPLGGILYAKASMLRQNVPPAVLVQFLREHRSEWVDFNVDAFVASALKSCPYTYLGMRPTRFTGRQIIMPLGHTIEHEEMLEVIRLEGQSIGHEAAFVPRDIHLLQMCSGTDKNAIGACSELVFASIDEDVADSRTNLFLVGENDAE